MRGGESVENSALNGQDVCASSNLKNDFQRIVAHTGTDTARVSPPSLCYITNATHEAGLAAAR